jgi:3-oxoacyl-[acyl-carrier protein] reductase
VPPSDPGPGRGPDIGTPLAGRVAVVTGASRGIGRATALRLATLGARVTAISRADHKGPAERIGDGSIEPLSLDIRSASAVRDAFAALEERHGAIDVLVNNAGAERVKPLDEVSDDDYAVTVDTNLRGAFHCVRAVLPGMKARRDGHVVSVASAAGIRGFADDAVYSASKFGIVGMMDSLDEELRPFGIRLTTICPGAVDTELVTWDPPGYRRHFLRPDDVAAAIAYAISQPPYVSVGLIVVRPFVEPPHSAMLPLETMAGLPGR